MRAANNNPRRAVTDDDDTHAEADERVDSMY
jgi:hypothetical protein